ncbi:MAG: FAD-dependent oxidoreductase [Deltaproteobacteria bacterium]|nr:FAD-dependent oxidoreductase [Deltaproteobacteria bacterium]
MNEIVFSSWGNRITDKRDVSKQNAGVRPSLPETFRQDEAIKAFIGWDGIVIRSDDVDIVDLCRAYMAAVRDQSCGKCIPCQTGTNVMAAILDKICRGEGTPADVERLGEVAGVVSSSAKCGVGKTGPIALMHALTYFPDAFAEAVSGKAPVKAGTYYTNVTAPCMDACPIHLDIPQYVELIKEGKFEKALDVIRCRLPVPGIVGRVCVRPCEENCRRANLDEAVSIKYLKRFVADHELAMHRAPNYVIEPSAKTGKVAVVGAGPAGVTCAYQLAKKGHAVTVFEGLGEPGGMSAMGIPDYRLPRHILRGEVERIQEMGVDIRYNTAVGRDVKLSQLEEDYDAVFIGIGAQGSSPMRVEGEDKGYKGFIPGVQYLKEINEGRDPYPEGKRVVVIGGGNVAIDCVRCSFRINKEDVNLVYRRTRAEMPADEVEIVDAEEEKVQFHFLTTPVRILEENGVVTGLECIRMKLGAPDKSGRRRPVPIEGSEFVFDCDTVVPAIGQRVDLSLLEGVDGVETTAWNTIIVDGVTKQTSRPKLFSAGDCETGPGALITACAGGRKAAQSIDRQINGLPLEYTDNDRFHELFAGIKVYDPDENLGDIGKRSRKHLEMMPPDTRKYVFDEVEKGYTTPDAREEARRCLRCYRISMVAV